MKPYKHSDEITVPMLVVVREGPAGQFTARAVGIPEVTATAGSREEAIDHVRTGLYRLWMSGELLSIDVPVNNPLLEWAGHWKDDPDFDVYLEEIRRFREEQDRWQQAQESGEQGGPASSSTPTT